LKKVLHDRGLSTADEGGFAPTGTEDALDTILLSIKNWLISGKDVMIARSCRCRVFCKYDYKFEGDKGVIRTQKNVVTQSSLILQINIPIISIEDGMDEKWIGMDGNSTEKAGHKVQLVEMISLM
jgi:enolase